jgi:excinuclease ABC subunit C
VPDGELYGAFIKQFYDGGVPIPARIVLPALPPEPKALADWLSGLRRRVCRLESPSRGRGLALLHLAASNAETSLTQRLEAEKAGERGLLALQKTLRLRRMPQRIEGFDISHIQGDLTVASMVVWEGAGPKKADYRHFRIRTTIGPDDFLAMGEVVTRRYQRLKDEGSPLPHLIVIDGGRGQLSAALRALAELKIDPEHMPDVLALAKERGERFERVFKPGLKEPITLKPGAPATRILQQIRDEAHRFAISYHRKLRSLRIQDSLLDNVPGVGKTRKRALLTAFGSIEGLRKASVEDIAAVPGVTRAVAERVRKALRG